MRLRDLEIKWGYLHWVSIHAKYAGVTCDNVLEKERDHAFFNRAFVLFLRLFVTSSLSKKDVPFGKLEMKRYKVLRTQNK